MRIVAMGVDVVCTGHDHEERAEVVERNGAFGAREHRQHAVEPGAWQARGVAQHHRGQRVRDHGRHLALRRRSPDVRPAGRDRVRVGRRAGARLREA